MYVFDSYVNMFLPHSVNTHNRAHSDQNKPGNFSTDGHFNDTISQSAYRLASRIENLLRSR